MSGVCPVNFARDPKVIQEENILNIPSFSKKKGAKTKVEILGANVFSTSIYQIIVDQVIKKKKRVFFSKKMGGGKRDFLGRRPFFRKKRGWNILN